ncbi:glycosyltransferase [Microlunatus sp. Gsoil 973]|uniref:glycosyltransferase n=1 Tax=Microlunatus sp. Gsoil 973 TaxID=2672569 RepID=UPI0012B451D1|nr:glycosyltransferase [Microlunatus sp. Gsoil 973]QGN34821.1 hypothetical protein GJV80_20580 [Microlunatus sp. Gsoil 973]
MPFAKACAAAGHAVRITAPESYAASVARTGLPLEPFADPEPEVIGPVMARLMSLSVQEADALVIREVFGRIDAQAALPSILEIVQRWRPQVIVREPAEVASLAAAERAEVPHAQVCIGMHETGCRLADSMAEPLEELGRLTGLADGRMAAAPTTETVLSVVPELLDYASGGSSPKTGTIRRFHKPTRPTIEPRRPEWGDPELPLVYLTFGSVTGSIPPFMGVFRRALDAVADLEASIVMTTGRAFDPETLGPLPDNARVLQWVPQEQVLAHAVAVLGHGGFGTTIGALAAGVPQVVVPLFTFDQVINGDRVAAVGAGVTTGQGPGNVERGAAELPRLLHSPGYGEAARRVATALAELPPPSEAVPVLVDLANR